MEDVLKIPRMETIKNTAALFKLPVHFVRQKVNSGEIVAVRAGNKYLVNVDKFAEYLNGSTITDRTEKPTDQSCKTRIAPISLNMRCT